MIYIIDHYDTGALHNDHWRTTVPELIRNSGLEVEVISGTKLISAIDDFNADIQYKLSQSNKIYTKMLTGAFQDGDVFILTDAYNIAVIILRQLLDLNGIKNYRMIGIWREGVFDSNSKFYNAMLFRDKGYIRRIESALYLAYNSSIFLHHAQIKRFTLYHNMRQTPRMIVSGYPIDIKTIAAKYDTTKKENIIIIPNRTFSTHVKNILLALKTDISNYNIIDSCALKLNRDEYYEVLRVAKYILTVTDEESDITNIYEGMCFGCIPIVPDTSIYKDIMRRDYIYPVKIIRAPVLNYIRGNRVISDMIYNFDMNYEAATKQLNIDTTEIGESFFTTDKFMAVLNHEVFKSKNPNKTRRLYEQRYKKVQLRY